MIFLELIKEKKKKSTSYEVFFWGADYGLAIKNQRLAVVYHPQFIAVYHQHKVLYIIKPQMMHAGA